MTEETSHPSLKVQASDLLSSDQRVYREACSTYVALAAIAEKTTPLRGAKPSPREVEAAIGSLVEQAKAEGHKLSLDSVSQMQIAAVALAFPPDKTKSAADGFGGYSVSLETAMGRVLYRIMRGKNDRLISSGRYGVSVTVR